MKRADYGDSRRLGQSSWVLAIGSGRHSEPLAAEGLSGLHWNAVGALEGGDFALMLQREGNVV